MAVGTCQSGMAKSEREKIMIDICIGPGETGDGMTFGAVLRIIGLNMVGLGC